MPLVKVSAPAHLSEERIRSLLDAVHDALVATCDVPRADRFQFVTRYGDDHRVIDPTFPDLQRSADASVIEVTLRRGRTDAQKRALYRQTVDGAVARGWRTDDIMIALTENTLADWTFGAGIAQYARE
jgi:4-oxalocrotonate tautomerase